MRVSKIKDKRFKNETTYPISSASHRLFSHQLLHQHPHRPILIHQLSRRTDKIIRYLSDTAEKGIFENPRTLIHPINQLSRISKHLRFIPRNASDLRNNHLVRWILSVPISINSTLQNLMKTNLHLLDIFDSCPTIRTIVMQ